MQMRWRGAVLGQLPHAPRVGLHVLGELGVDRLELARLRMHMM